MAILVSWFLTPDVRNLQPYDLVSRSSRRLLLDERDSGVKNLSH